jgi:hypothetical protein
MNLLDKIEAIRQQPENIRMRWVWGCVAVSMAIVFAIWIFYLTTLFKNSPAQPAETTDSSIEDLKQQFQDIKEQTTSLKTLDSQPLPAMKDNQPTVNTSSGKDSVLSEPDAYSNPQSNSGVAQ